MRHKKEQVDETKLIYENRFILKAFIYDEAHWNIVTIRQIAMTFVIMVREQGACWHGDPPTFPPTDVYTCAVKVWTFIYTLKHVTEENLQQVFDLLTLCLLLHTNWSWHIFPFLALRFKLGWVIEFGLLRWFCHGGTFHWSPITTLSTSPNPFKTLTSAHLTLFMLLTVVKWRVVELFSENSVLGSIKKIL